jgi:hypothetical protein
VTLPMRVLVYPWMAYGLVLSLVQMPERLMNQVEMHSKSDPVSIKI